MRQEGGGGRKERERREDEGEEGGSKKKDGGRRRSNQPRAKRLRKFFGITLAFPYMIYRRRLSRNTALIRIGHTSWRRNRG